MRFEIRNLKLQQKVRHLSSSSGQAIVEMLIGIVALLVLIAGLLQVATLSSGQTATMVQARYLAGKASMEDPEASTPDYIKNWQVGPDGKRYTADDVSTPADTAAFESTIIGKASPDAFGWTLIDSVPKNELSVIHKSGTPQNEFGFVEGTDSTNVDLLPVIQSLVYRADSIKISSDVWMTCTKGIYGQGDNN